MTDTKTPASIEVGAAPEPTSLHRDGGRTDIVVALAQMAPRLGDVASNVDRHLELITQARQVGADLVVFPELSLTGYFLKDLVGEVALRQDADELGRLAEAADGIEVVLGCVVESPDMRFHNAAVHLAGGVAEICHRKVYLPTYGLFDEHRYFAAGDRFCRYSLTLGSAQPPRPWWAGTLICEDMWHPSAASLLARQGIDLFICPSASPGRGVGQGPALGTALSYDAMTRTYAQLHVSYMVYVNRVGYEDGVAFWGGSRVVGPDGLVVADPASREEVLVLHRLDLAALRRARLLNPLLRDERHDITDAENERIRRTGY